MQNVTLFTTHCPKCKILEAKLKQKGIDYVECDDLERMKDFGISSAPILKVDEQVLDFNNAIKWINSRGN